MVCFYVNVTTLRTLNDIIINRSMYFVEKNHLKTYPECKFLLNRLQAIDEKKVREIYPKG